MFETISKYWAAPISNALMVLAAIVILRPIIKKLAIDQLAAAIRAMEEARNLPKNVADLVKAAQELRGVNDELITLNEKIAGYEALTEQLVVINRRVEELQKTIDERPPEGSVEIHGRAEEAVDVDSWDKAAQAWFAVKQHVEEIIEGLDGRRRRPFNRIPRYRYDEITERLRELGLVSHAKAKAIIAMDEAFRSIRNRKRPVTPEMVAKFEAWRKVVMKDVAAAPA